MVRLLISAFSILEGQYATGLNTVQEKVLILPESLPHSQMLDRILASEKNPSLLKEIRLRGFQESGLLVWRTVEMTGIPIPKFLKDRSDQMQKIRVPCTKFALRLEAFGEVKEGVGRVKDYGDNGFILESLSEKIEDVRGSFHMKSTSSE